MFYVLLINYVLWSIYNILQGSGTASGTVVPKRSSRICCLNSRLIYHIRKGVPASPLFKAPIRWPRLLPPFLKSLFPLFSFLLHSLLRYFDSSPQPHANPSCPNRPTNPPWIKQISKGRFCQFNRYFLSKSFFNLLNPFTNRLS